MLSRDGGKIDELEVGLVDGEHARLRVLGGEGISADLGMGSGESSVQRRLARVRRANDRHLSRAVWMDVGRRAGFGPSLGRGGELFPELLDLGLDFSSEVFGSLVLRDGPVHVAQQVEPLVRICGAPVGRFRLFVLGRQVGRHFPRARGDS